MRKLLAVLLLLPMCSWAQDAAVTLTYQGHLTGMDDAPVNGNRAVTYRLYLMSEGGEALWTEEHEQVDVVDGRFVSVLGSTSPLPGDLDPGAAIYLGVQVAEEDEFIPRLVVGGALKAQWAAVAEQAKDVAGRHIHPSAVSIGDDPVIDEQGRWVGDPAGLQGPAGPVGPAGPQGDPGPAAQQGIQGPPGGAGAQGPPGADGPAGPRGPVGEAVDLGRDGDNDGVPDWIEILSDSDPADGNAMPADVDQNGVPDVLQGPEGPQGPPGGGVDAGNGVVRLDGLDFEITDANGVVVLRFNAEAGRLVQNVTKMHQMYSTLSFLRMCGLDKYGRFTRCWGPGPQVQTPPPPFEGAITQLFAFSNEACALMAEDGSIRCWGEGEVANRYGELDAPEGPFESFTLAQKAGCGIRPDRRVECWGEDFGGSTRPPAGVYRHIDMETHYGCGILADNDLVCWGLWWNGFEWVELPAPDGNFTFVDSHGEGACAVTEAGAVVCWGRGSIVGTEPDGEFSEVEASTDGACALTIAGQPVCWGTLWEELDVPSHERLTTIRNTGGFACGLRLDESVACWGNVGGGVP